MRNPVSMRRLDGGMPGMLLALLVLLARLIAPSMAMPGPANPADALAITALNTICHSGSEADGRADRDRPSPLDHGDCQLCPACHLVAQHALPQSGAGMVPGGNQALIGRAAPLPPATAPPSRTRVAAHPTGPPALSA